MGEGRAYQQSDVRSTEVRVWFTGGTRSSQKLKSTVQCNQYRAGYAKFSAFVATSTRGPSCHTLVGLWVVVAQVEALTECLIGQTFRRQ